MRVLGAGLMVAGVVLCLSAAAIGARGIAWQARHQESFAAVPERADPGKAGPGGPAAAPDAILPPASEQREAPRPTPVRGSAVARLRIPRVGIDVVVAEGTDPATLRLGPGHMVGSALPGAGDNCIIAGHRDGPFRRLGDLSIGDRVEVSGSTETGIYRVESIEVVDQSDTEPLGPTAEPVLTLVTCYPFNHVGPAPRRLIVRAALTERPGMGS